MVKNIIFDFDGVLVDSEILFVKSVGRYFLSKGYDFEEKEFYKMAGTKTVDVVEDLSKKFNIKDKEVFFNDIMEISKNLYFNELEPIKGVENFLKKINCNKLIGSNNIKSRIIEGLEKINLINFFDKNMIFSFDIVGVPKPNPDIYLQAIETAKINKNECIIIEDSVVGTQAGVAAGVKVIGITAGGHWYEGRSDKELLDAGAYKVVKNYDTMLSILNEL